MKFHDFLIDPDLGALGALSFRTWHTTARIIDGDAHLLTADELVLAQLISQRSRFPTQPVREFCAAPGRRAGKSLFGSRIACHAAAQDYRDRLAPGETAVIACIATDKKQAGILFDYCRACVAASPLMAPKLVRETADTLEFTHRTAIEVYAASFRTTRGRTFALVLLDEAAFLRSEDSAIPDAEIVRAVRPGLITLSGRLVVLSSPYMRRGVLFDAYKKHFGNDTSPALYVTGESRLFNGTLDAGLIAASIEDDPEAGASEWGGLFRADLAAALDPAWIDAATCSGVFERAPVASLPEGRHPEYMFFTDPAGGADQGDSWSTTGVYVEGDNLVQAATLELRPPFSTAEAARQTADFIKRYGTRRVAGDHYAGNWPRDALAQHGIAYHESELTKSQIYLETIPLFSAGRVKLLDHARTLTQLRQLERRVRPGGKDVVDHPAGCRDDNSNSLCGALHRAARALNAGDQTTAAAHSSLWAGYVDSPTYDPHAEFRAWYSKL